jgi:hypothetical protein
MLNHCMVESKPTHVDSGSLLLNLRHGMIYLEVIANNAKSRTAHAPPTNMTTVFLVTSNSSFLGVMGSFSILAIQSSSWDEISCSYSQYCKVPHGTGSTHQLDKSVPCHPQQSFRWGDGFVFNSSNACCTGPLYRRDISPPF